MSKQLKFKFKKTLKKAEFVHADLEYHQELISEAKRMFSEEIKNFIDKLSPEEQLKLKQESDKWYASQINMHQATTAKNDKLKQIEEEVTKFINKSGSTSLITTTIATEDEPDIEDPDQIKSIELKKLFRKIAEQTHPDKAQANGFSDKEVNRQERIFKKALQAYNDNNWYILYSIALDLNIKIDAVTEDSINWVEDDIRNTIGAIAKIGNLISWVWYIGDEPTKKHALRDYFQQMYNFNHPDL